MLINRDNYTVGIDSCSPPHISFWNKIRKFLGLSYKQNFLNSGYCVYKKFENGDIKIIKGGIHEYRETIRGKTSK